MRSYLGLGPAFYFHFPSTNQDAAFASAFELSAVLTFDSYMKLFFEYNFLKPMLNSLLVASVTTVVSLTVSLLAAYAFSRYRFRGRNFFMTLFLTNNMFPTVLLLIPLFAIIRRSRRSDCGCSERITAVDGRALSI